MTEFAHVAMGDGPEFDAIRLLLSTWGPRAEGIGDDAAIVSVPPGEQLCVSTDACVQDVHFRRDWLSNREIGARAAAAALSDLAAMAATPVGLLVAMGVPDDWRSGLEDLARGIGDVAARTQCPIVGGNICSAQKLSLTITVLGRSPQPLRRSTLAVGDLLFVTGCLGGPGAALKALMAGEEPAHEHWARFVAPVPRIVEAQWLAAQGATCGIDISDGLLGDAIHLARASGVSLVLDLPAIPIVSGVQGEDAVRSGEEYELLVGHPACCVVDVHEFQRRFELPLTQIGHAVEAGDSPVYIDGRAGARMSSFDHFSSP